MYLSEMVQVLVKNRGYAVELAELHGLSESQVSGKHHLTHSQIWEILWDEATRKDNSYAEWFIESLAGEGMDSALESLTQIHLADLVRHNQLLHNS